MIRTVLSSIAKAAVIPVQDLLRLGSSARMNSPGRSSTRNWTWRLRQSDLNEEAVQRLARWNDVFGRVPTKLKRETHQNERNPE
jgi:4-alpha-glucanotransferase